MDDALIKRVLPHSLEAEQSVIGSMLMDREAIITASEIVTADDFYQHQYGVMYESMVELFNEGKPVDLVTLQNRLKEKDVPPEVSSLEFVRDIITTVPTSANVKYYATIVKEKAVLRRLIRVNEEIANDCYLGRDPLETILADTEKKIFDLLQSRSSGDFVPIRQVALNVLENIEKASKTKETVTGVPTGFIDLDYKTSGFQPSDFILIAARPSMGKTAFVLNVVDHVAVKKGIPCMVFSLEMSKEQLVNRMLSMESNVDSQKLRTGTLTDSDWDAVVEGVGIIGGSKLIIDDTPGISISELRSKCRKMKLEHGLGMVIIDYLQLMTGSGKSSDNRQQEISEISRSLKALARGDFSEKMLSRYQKELENSFVMKDLKTYRNLMDEAHNRSESFMDYYLREVNGFFRMFTTVDSIPKREKFRKFIFDFIKKRNIIELIKDAFSAFKLLWSILIK